LHIHAVKQLKNKRNRRVETKSAPRSFSDPFAKDAEDALQLGKPECGLSAPTAIA